MPIRRKKDVDGDLWIPGSITVLGGINSSAYKKTVTKVASTEDRVTAAEGDIEVIESVVATLASDTLALSKTLSLSTSNIYRSRTDALTPGGVSMAVIEQDGSSYPCRFTVELSHDGITYQSPAAYTSSSDEASHSYIPASAKMSVSGTDYYIAMIRVRYYVAGGTTTLLGEELCVISPDPSNAAMYLGIGILEDEDIATFESATVDDEGTITVGSDITVVYPNDTMVNYADGGVSALGMYKWSGSTWVKTTNLTDLGKAITDFMGLLAAGITLADATTVTLLIAKYILAQQVDVTGQLSVQSGGRFRAYNGQGVQRRCVQLADDRVDWLDTPDGGDELLVGRIGRLGVASPILMDGDINSPIASGWGDESVITAGYSYFPVYIQLNDGELKVAYKRGTDGYLVERTFGGSTWGAEVVVNAAGSNYIDYIQLASGQLRIAYKRLTDSHLVERIWSGSSWGVELDISEGVSFYSSYIQLSNGQLRMAYVRNSDGYLVERFLIEDEWSEEVVINTASSALPEYIQLNNGQLRIAYVRNSDTYLVERIYINGSWGSENVINASASLFPSYIQLIDSELRIAYVRGSDNYLVERIWSGSSWGSEVVVNATYSYFADYIQLSDGQLRLTYAPSGGSLVERTLQRYAQIGAGIVADYIDSTSGARVLKYGNGTMTATWEDTTVRSLTLTSGSFYYYSTGAKAMPAGFVGTIYATPTGRTAGGFIFANHSFSGSNIYVYLVTVGSGASGYPGYKLEGRWK